MDNRIVRSLLKCYVDAREDHILRRVSHGEEPDHPSGGLNALLQVLIDRHIVFNTTFIPLRKSSIQNFNFRLNDRLSAFTAALDTLKTQSRNEEVRYVDSVVQQNIVEREEASKSMYDRLMPMVPAAELQPAFSKLWFTEAWLRKTLPESEWPSKVKRVTATKNKQAAGPNRQKNAAATAQDDKMVVESPESTMAQQQIQAPMSSSAHQEPASTGTKNKRKR